MAADVSKPGWSESADIDSSDLGIPHKLAKGGQLQYSCRLPPLLLHHSLTTSQMTGMMECSCPKVAPFGSPLGQFIRTRTSTPTMTDSILIDLSTIANSPMSMLSDQIGSTEISLLSDSSSKLTFAYIISGMEPDEECVRAFTWPREACGASRPNCSGLLNLKNSLIILWM